MRHRVDLFVFSVLVTLVCAAVVVAVPSDKTVTFHIFLLVLGGLLLVTVVAEIRAAMPQRRKSELAASAAHTPERTDAGA